MKKINIKNNTNELFPNLGIQKNNKKNSKRFFTKFGVFFIPDLFASIITIFADSNPDANDDENDNIRECQIEITKPTEIKKYEGFFENNHTANFVAVATAICGCSKTPTVTTSAGNIGGGPSHYSGSTDITWTANCPGGGTATETATAEYDFTVFKLESFKQADIKFLDTDNSGFITENLIAVFTPDGIPHTKVVAGKAPSKEELSVWTGKVEVNGKQIGSTISLNVYNSNWLSSNNESSFFNTPLINVIDTSRRSNDWLGNGYIIEYEQANLGSRYDTVIQSESIVGSGSASFVSVELKTTELSSSYSNTASINLCEYLSFQTKSEISISNICSKSETVSVNTPITEGVNWKLVVTQGESFGHGITWKFIYEPEYTTLIFDSFVGGFIQIKIPEKNIITAKENKNFSFFLKSANREIFKKHTRPKSSGGN